MRWTLTSLVTLVIGIVVLAACEGNVFSLKVGDCYNGPLTNTEEHTEIPDVEVVSCDDPHKNEVYAVFELPDSSWKGLDYVYEQTSIGCLARFEAYVGIEYERSTLYGEAIYPLEKSWKEKDNRKVLCSVTEVTEESVIKVSGSVKGSRR